MSSAPTVSVLTTVYNRAKFLGECIESVQQSKFKDYEHIIVDDGSTDDSIDIAKRYAQEDPKIKVFINDRNLGDYPNRNQAAKHATGKYLKYLDADDMHSPYILDILVDCMEQFPQAGLGLFIHGKGCTHKAQCVSPQEAFELHYSNGITILNRSPLGAIISRSSFKTVGGFPDLQHVGDHELWHRLASHYHIVLLPTNLAYYRVHDDQQSADNRRDFRVPFKYFDAAIRGTNLEGQNVLSAPFKSHITQIIRRKQARTIFVMIRRLKIRAALTLQKQSKLGWMELWNNAK
ncbi:glycosyltransferase [Flavobacteriales bacterium]|nr:glycosyltransferase [Flavobacteriales bacterium]